MLHKSFNTFIYLLLIAASICLLSVQPANAKPDRDQLFKDKLIRYRHREARCVVKVKKQIKKHHQRFDKYWSKADQNYDRKVDNRDVEFFNFCLNEPQATIGRKKFLPGDCAKADLDSDGKITSRDLAIFVLERQKNDERILTEAEFDGERP